MVCQKLSEIGIRQQFRIQNLLRSRPLTPAPIPQENGYLTKFLHEIFPSHFLWGEGTRDKLLFKLRIFLSLQLAHRLGFPLAIRLS